MTDKRLFTRVPSSLEVDVHLDSGELLGGRLSNLSIRGFYFHASELPPIGAKCTCVLFPATHDHPELKIEVRGSVARIANGGIGIRFTEFALEAFEHLRELVSFAADDPEVIEREIDQHLGSQRETA